MHMTRQRTCIHVMYGKIARSMNGLLKSCVCLKTSKWSWILLKFLGKFYGTVQKVSALLFTYIFQSAVVTSLCIREKIFFAIERRERVIESKNVCLSPKKYGNSFTIELSLDKKAIFYFFKLLQVWVERVMVYKCGK